MPRLGRRKRNLVNGLPGMDEKVFSAFSLVKVEEDALSDKRKLCDVEPYDFEWYLDMTKDEAEVLFDRLIQDRPEVFLNYEDFVSWLDPFRQETEITRKMAFLSGIKHDLVARLHGSSSL